MLTKSPKWAWQSQEWDAFPRNPVLNGSPCEEWLWVYLMPMAMCGSDMGNMPFPRHMWPQAHLAAGHLGFPFTGWFFFQYPRPPNRRLKYPNRGQERSLAVAEDTSAWRSLFAFCPGSCSRKPLPGGWPFKSGSAKGGASSSVWISVLGDLAQILCQYFQWRLLEVCT